MKKTVAARGKAGPATGDSKVEVSTEPKIAGDEQADIDTPRSWLVPIATVAILALAFCLYYFVYVGARREYLVNRNFRSLAALGRYIQRVVSTYGSILELYADLRQPVQEKALGAEERMRAVEKQFLLVRPEDRQMRVDQQEEEARKDYLQFLAPNLSLIPLERESKALPRLGIRRRDDRWEMVLSAHRHAKSDKDFLGSLDIDGMLRPAAHSSPFDDILLVSDDGKVVYQQRKAGPQFTTLSSLLKARVEAAANKPGGSDKQGGASESSDSKKAENGGGEDSDSKQEGQGWQAAGIHLTDVLLAGTSYKLFLQPILIDINSDEPGRTEPPREWVLCGLRANSTLQWEAFSISYTLMIGFTALFFSVCMGGPVLKVILMNQRERFPLRELGILSLFLVLLAGVFTLTTLEIVDVRAASHTDAQLRSLGDSLSSNVHDDLRQMREQLLDWCRSEDLHKDLIKAADRVVIRNTPAPDDSNLKGFNVEVTPAPGKYPFLLNAFWTDDDGHQVVKWSTSRYVTPLMPVSGLPIYTEPKRIYLDGKGPPFYFDSTVPRNKLEYLTALTMSTADCRPDPNQEIRGDLQGGSAFVTGQPFSLIDPILPFGFGFAIIDDAGRVLFHSDKTKDGQENFREENDWNKELYAGTFGHASQKSLSINYMGRDYLARVVPIEGLRQAPWSLIVYADLEAERTLALQTMTMAATLFLLIVAGPAVVAAIWSIGRRPRFAPEWIWPDPHRVATYLYQIGIYTVMIVAFLFLGFRGPSEQIVISCAAVPYSTIFLTYWCFRRYPSARYALRDRDPVKPEFVPVAFTVLSAAAFLMVLVVHWSHIKALAGLLAVVGIAAVPLLEKPRQYISVLDRRRRRRQAAGGRVWPFMSHSTCYAASVLLLLLLIGVLTPMALFRASLAVERRLSVKQAQLHLASALAERRATLMEKCEAGELGAAACDELEKKDTDVWKKIVLNPPKVAGQDPQPLFRWSVVPELKVVPPGAARELYEDWFRSLIYLLHHEYNTTAAETLGVIQDRIPPKPGGNVPDWSWENPAENPPSTVALRWHGLRPLPSDIGSEKAALEEKDLVITSDVVATPRGDVLSGIGVALGVMVVIGGVLWMLVRKVFLIDVAPLKMTGVREVAECIRTGRNVLILVPPPAGYRVGSAAESLDLRVMAAKRSWYESDKDMKTLPLLGLIEIRHFEYANDQATEDQKLSLLQRLTQGNRQIAPIMELAASTFEYRHMFGKKALDDLKLTVVDLRDEPSPFREVADTGGNVLILVPPGTTYNVDSAEKKTLDLEKIAIEANWAERVNPESWTGLIEIRHFEYTSEVATTDQKHRMLKRLTLKETSHVAAIMEAPAYNDEYRSLFWEKALEDLKLILVDLRDEPSRVREVTECIRMGRNVLILALPPPRYEVEAAEKKILDLEKIAMEAEFSKRDKRGHWAEEKYLESLSGLIEIRHFEYTSDMATTDQKYRLLKRLAQKENTYVAAIMEVPASTDDYHRIFPSEDLNLTVVDLREEPFLWKKQYEGPAQDLIWEECRPMAALWPLGAQLAKEIRQEPRVSDDTIASEMLERAGAYYRLFWEDCTPAQQFVLSQLAEDGMMNPTNGQEIRHLIRSGVIVREPQFRIMNESFRRFLRSATTSKMKQRWHAESRLSGWGKVQGAFFTTMIVLGVFLLTTQNALWQSSAAYVTGAFGALSTLAKLVNPTRGAAKGEKAD